MIFSETPLKGAYLVNLEHRTDERGFFARAWCADEFERQGLCSRVSQANISFNHSAGTLRGLHYQKPPHAEVKLIRCSSGAIWDVIVDLRRSSPTYRQWFGAELTAENRTILYVPENFAHGYLTLLPNTETAYQVSEPYAPGAEKGIRWDDPAFGIVWPDIGVKVISDKDASHPNFKDD